VSNLAIRRDFGLRYLQVGILLSALNIALVPIFAEAIQVKGTAGGISHHAEECSIEIEIVSLAEEVVISGQRRIALEFVVAIQSGLAACQ